MRIKYARVHSFWELHYYLNYKMEGSAILY